MSRGGGDAASALDTFTQLVEKFPKSQYVLEAQQHIAEIKQQIFKLDQIKTGMSKLEAALQTQEFNIASAELRKLKPLISDEGYKGLSKLIYEEQNKPIEADMRDIAAEPLHYVGKRLKLKLVVVGNEISRSSFRTHPYSNNITGLDPDISVEVFYDGVSDKSTWRHLESNKRPMISVIGVFNIYSNDWSKGYIKAESILPL